MPLILNGRMNEVSQISLSFTSQFDINFNQIVDNDNVVLNSGISINANLRAVICRRRILHIQHVYKCEVLAKTRKIFSKYVSKVHA